MSELIYHILVKHEYEAIDLLKKLNQDMDQDDTKNTSQNKFEQLAQKFSQCPSAKQGGLLGPYKPGRFVEAFSEAVEQLKLNEISKPIRTQFGYHLIKKQLMTKAG